MKIIKLGDIEYRVIREGKDKVTGETVYLLENIDTSELSCFYSCEGILYKQD